MPPKLRNQRVWAGQAASASVLRVQRVWAGTQAPTALLRVQRVWAGLQAAPTAGVVTVTAASSTSGTVRAYRQVTLWASATAPAGDSIASYSWTTLSSNSPPLSDIHSMSPTFRVRPELQARPYQWQVTVTSVAGASGTATVSVNAPKSKAFSIGLDGARHATEFIGINPSAGTPPPPPPPPFPRSLRVNRVWAGVQGAATVVDPGTGANNTLLVGGRVNLPGNTGNVTSWFAAGEARWGELQCTKDYFSGGPLPGNYNSPFPSRVTILLSFAKDTVFGNSTIGQVDDPTSNFATYMRSVPSGTIVTFQHEPERPGVYGSDPSGYVTLFNQFRTNVRRYRTDLPVWLLSSGYQYRTGNPGYNGDFFSGIQADGYGFDGYRAGTNTSPQGLLVNPMQNRDEFNRWRSFIPSGKPWGVSETGFGRCDYPPNYAETGLYAGIINDRRTSCQATYDWLLQQPNAKLFLLFFSGDGPDLHNWFPNPNETAFDTMFNGLARKT